MTAQRYVSLTLLTSTIGKDIADIIELASAMARQLLQSTPCISSFPLLSISLICRLARLYHNAVRDYLSLEFAAPSILRNCCFSRQTLTIHHTPLSIRINSA